MLDNGNGKHPLMSVEEQTSSSSSDVSGSSSTPNTPPSPVVQPHTPPQALPRVPPAENGRYSANGPKRSPPKSTPSKSRLGVIDEHSDAVSPDVPDRNPRRMFALPYMNRKFYLPNIPTLHATRSPPKGIYDDVEGPNGEKFADVRKNNKTAGRRRLGWRMLVCLACLALILAAAVAIGVIVGLKVRSNKHKTQNVPTNSTNPGVNGTFPAGQYAISTYLNNVTTSCTSNSATWRCYPYETYEQSVSASLTTLSWIIRQQNGSNFTISSADRTFSYTFQDVPLTNYMNGTDGEYWSFTTKFDKVVIPSTAITSDGSNARCYYNGTTLNGKLYTKKPKAQALQNATATNSGTLTTGGTVNTYQAWPYALDFYESINNGAGVPTCYKYINGQIGENLDINSTISAVGSTRDCTCAYTNFFPMT